MTVYDDVDHRQALLRELGPLTPEQQQWTDDHCLARHLRARKGNVRCVLLVNVMAWPCKSSCAAMPVRVSACNDGWGQDTSSTQQVDRVAEPDERRTIHPMIASHDCIAQQSRQAAQEHP
jgi:hypothetical protein